MARGLNRGLRIDFNQDAQEGLINNRGVEMIHEFGLSCTCREADAYASTQDDGESYRSEPFCTRCGGDKWLFRDPKLVVGLFTGVRFSRNILDAGMVLDGDSTFSPLPSIPDCPGRDRRIGTRDKLTATWPEPIDDGHIIVRGSGYRAKLQGVETFLEENEDRLAYEPAHAVWCEDENGVVYTEGGDFELGPGKIIKWIGNQPDVGIKFSIKYYGFFEWIVYEAPTERRDANRDLGDLIKLRKRHVMYVNDSPFADSKTKESLQANVKI